MLEVNTTEVGKAWLQNHYSQSIVGEYNVDKPLRLHGWTREFIEFTHLGIPCRMPTDVDGQPTIRKAA